MKITIDSMIDISGTTSSELDAIIKANRWPNPAIASAKKMKRSYHHLPQYVCTYQMIDTGITVPVGFLDELLELFPDCEVTDNRTLCPADIPPLNGITLRDYQQQAISDAAHYTNGIIQSGTGCHAKGTLIMTATGRIVPVESITVDDELMGIDSNPRTVTALHRGIDEMFMIAPVKGESFIVNGGHILSLKNTSNRKVIEISVKNYLSKSNRFKHLYKLWRIGVDYPKKKLPFDPYLLGVILGDGGITQRTTGVTTPEPEIVTELHKAANNFGVNLRESKGQNCSTYCFTQGMKGGLLNPVTGKLRELSLHGLSSKSKFIPAEYLTSSREQRAELLAGLLDTDGHYSNGGYDYVTASEELADNILTLVRSLGLAAYRTIKQVKGYEWDYQRISISGDATFLPLRVHRKKAQPRKMNKSVLVTGFKVNPVGMGSYYGFECSNDHLYLTSDFTVHHNSGKTIMGLELIHRKQQKTLILTHSKELMSQWQKEIKSLLNVDCGLIGGGKETQADITLAMLQTLAKRPELLEQLSNDYGLVLIEECHHIPSNTFSKVINQLACHYRFGLTATPSRRDGLHQLINRHIGDIVAKVSDKQIHAVGGVVPIVIKPIKTGRSYRCDSWQDYITALTEDYERNQLIIKIAKKASKTAPTIILTDRVVHAEALAEMLPESLLIHGQLPARERKQRMQSILDYKIVIGTSQTLGEGIDVPHLSSLILSAPISSRVKLLQAVGRICRKFDGKKAGYVADLIDNCGFSYSSYRKRLVIYREKEFRIVGQDTKQSRGVA